MKITPKLAGWAFAALVALSCSQKLSFVTVQDGQFMRGGKPYTYIGTNFWYGPILASDTESGDFGRLTMELDTLKALGLTNLRVLVGAQGADGVFSRVEPTLEKEPGVYDEALLVGLDRFLVELGKRDMQAVLYLNNSWEWSGGYGQYMEWATGEKALIPLIDGYVPFMQQMARFQTCAPAQELFYNHVKAIVGRTNSLTGKPYNEDPAIFAWQIGNEPRCFSSEKEVQDGFIGWLTETARIIKQLDPNHLLSTGSEGVWGCEMSEDLKKTSAEQTEYPQLLLENQLCAGDRLPSEREMCSMWNLNTARRAGRIRLPPGRLQPFPRSLHACARYLLCICVLPGGRYAPGCQFLGLERFCRSRPHPVGARRSLHRRPGPGGPGSEWCIHHGLYHRCYQGSYIKSKPIINH